MYSKVIVVLAALALAGANDIYQAANGTDYKQVYEHHFQAEWSWGQQSKDVFVNATKTITQINVTDLRDGKDGIAQIVSGGLGHNNVTISLKSPAPLRGYDFLVAVFAEDAENIERGSRGEPEMPQLENGNNTLVPALPIGTGRPDMAMMPTVKPETNKTEVPADDETEVTVPTTVSTDGTASNNVTALPIGTGRPDTAIFPTIKPADRTDATPTKAVPEETEVPEEIEHDRKQAFVGFHPPPTGV